MKEKRKEEKGDEEEGIRKTITFREETRKIIEGYRREQNKIPTFTEAVNEIIMGQKQ